MRRKSRARRLLIRKDERERAEIKRRLDELEAKVEALEAYRDLAMQQVRSKTTGTR